MHENPYKPPEVPAERRRMRWLGRISVILFLIAGLSLVVLLRLESGGKPRLATDALSFVGHLRGGVGCSPGIPRVRSRCRAAQIRGPIGTAARRRTRERSGDRAE